MAAVLFDTHKVVTDLKAAGFTNEQAEAVTQAVRDAQSVDLSNLATKADLQIGLAEIKADILKWIVSTIGIQTVVIVGAVIALVRMVH